MKRLPPAHEDGQADAASVGTAAQSGPGSLARSFVARSLESAALHFERDSHQPRDGDAYNRSCSRSSTKWNRNWGFFRGPSGGSSAAPRLSMMNVEKQAPCVAGKLLASRGSLGNVVESCVVSVPRGRRLGRRGREWRTSEKHWGGRGIQGR